jgi:hypothetical protein
MFFRQHQAPTDVVTTVVPIADLIPIEIEKNLITEGFRENKTPNALKKCL